MTTKVKKKISVVVLTLLNLHLTLVHGALIKNSTSSSPQPQNSNSPPSHEASLLISELFFDPSNQGQGYIELYGRENMTLTNYSIVIYGGPHLKPVTIINLINESAHSDGAFVIGSQDIPEVDKSTNASMLSGNFSILALYKNLDKGFNKTSSLTRTGLEDYVIYGINNYQAYEKELRVFAPESPVLLKEMDEVLYSNGSFSKCYSSSPRDVRGFTITKQTPGRMNDCPNVKPVINEVGISKTDEGCFIEVYTLMKKKVFLNSYVISTFTQNGSDIKHNTYDLWNRVTNEKGFFLLSGKGDNHKMKLNCSESFSGNVSAVVMYQVTGNLTDFVLKLPTDFHLQNVTMFHTSKTEPNEDTSVLMLKLKQNSSFYIENVTEFMAGKFAISRCNQSFISSEPTPGISNICKQSSKPTSKLTTKATPATTKLPTQTTPKLSTQSTNATTTKTKLLTTATHKSTPKNTTTTLKASTKSLSSTIKTTAKPKTTLKSTLPSTNTSPNKKASSKPTTETTFKSTSTISTTTKTTLNTSSPSTNTASKRTATTNLAAKTTLISTTTISTSTPTNTSSTSTPSTTKTTTRKAATSSKLTTKTTFNSTPSTSKTTSKGTSKPTSKPTTKTTSSSTQLKTKTTSSTTATSKLTTKAASRSTQPTATSKPTTKTTSSSTQPTTKTTFSPTQPTTKTTSSSTQPKTTSRSTPTSPKTTPRTTVTSKPATKTTLKSTQTISATTITPRRITTHNFTPATTNSTSNSTATPKLTTKTANTTLYTTKTTYNSKTNIISTSIPTTNNNTKTTTNSTATPQLTTKTANTTLYTTKTTYKSKTNIISTSIPTTNNNTKTTTNSTGMTTTAQAMPSKEPMTTPHSIKSVFLNEIKFATSGQISFIELNATGDYSFQPKEYSVVIIDGISGEKLNFIMAEKGTKLNNGLFIINHLSVTVKNFPKKSFAVALYHKQMKQSDNIEDKSLVDAVVIKIDDTKMNKNVTHMMHSKATVHFDMENVKKEYSVSRCSYRGRLDSNEFSWTKPTPKAKNVKCHKGSYPNPEPTKSNDKNIKVTVAVVVSCLAVFLVIVGIVVIYMKKKQKAVLQFHLTRLDDDDDDLITNMESIDQDDMLIGNEPTFSNNLYNKMQN